MYLEWTELCCGIGGWIVGESRRVDVFIPVVLVFIYVKSKHVFERSIEPFDQSINHAVKCCGSKSLDIEEVEYVTKQRWLIIGATITEYRIRYAESAESSWHACQQQLMQADFAWNRSSWISKSGRWLQDVFVLPQSRR